MKRTHLGIAGLLLACSMLSTGCKPAPAKAPEAIDFHGKDIGKIKKSTGQPLTLQDLSSEAKEIGKITKSTGAVSIISGIDIITLTEAGLKLKTGDKIKTDEGDVEIEMNDGALMKVSPFTVASSAERVEKKRILLWKKDEDVRRVTCYVGKIWFKSGEKSEKKNYLQTPTAVCALRGADGDVGFDNKSSFLNMYHGTVTIQGNVNQGAFGNFGRNTAAGSAVYNAISRAIQAAESARVAGRQEPAKEILDLLAEKAVLAVGLDAADALLLCPDPAVHAYASDCWLIAKTKADAHDGRIVDKFTSSAEWFDTYKLLTSHEKKCVKCKKCAPSD